MTMPGVCDSVPPNRQGPRPQLPTLAKPQSSVGAIVGTAAEAETGLALSYSTVNLASLDGPTSGRVVAADSLGGFAFDSLQPGTYRVMVRWFDHRYQTRDFFVKPAAIDTFLAVLRYYRCTGY